MVLRDHVVPCVVLRGIPVLSTASAFMLRKALNADVLGAFARRRWARDQPSPPQDPASFPPRPAQQALPLPTWTGKLPSLWQIG